MAKAVGAVVSLGVAAAYAAPLVLRFGLDKSEAEVQTLMTPWKGVLEGTEKGNILSDENAWGALCGGTLLLYNFFYAITLHAGMPAAQGRVTGLMRMGVSAGLVFLHVKLGVPNMSLLIAGNDLLTGLLNVLLPTSAMLLIPNTFITSALGAMIFMPNLRPTLDKLFAQAAAMVPPAIKINGAKIEPLSAAYPTPFYLGIVLMACYAILPLVAATTMNTRCLRATGKTAAYAVAILGAAHFFKLLDKEAAMAYGGAHAVVAALLLLLVPKEAARPQKKQKAL